MYKRILVPVDGSGASRRGLEEAIKVARESQAELRVLHVVNEHVLTGPYEPAQNVSAVIGVLRELGKRTLNEAKAFATTHGMNVEPVLLEAVGGHASDHIVEYANTWPADLIVMGTHGRRGLRRLTMGSDADMVVRHANVPVLLVRGND